MDGATDGKYQVSDMGVTTGFNGEREAFTFRGSPLDA